MRLNLGCGPHTLIGFENWDLEHGQDLRKPFPIADKSVEFISSEHFIEHLTKPEAIAFLKECHRVLEDDGIFLLSQPDLEFLCRSHVEKRIPYTGVWRPKSLCDMVNEGMREWGHQYLWDENELMNRSREIGFHGMCRVMFSPKICVRPFCGDLIVVLTKTPDVMDTVKAKQLMDKYVV